MLTLEVGRLAEVTRGELIAGGSSQMVNSLATDSRRVEPGVGEPGHHPGLPLLFARDGGRRPEALAGIESLPQRVEVMEADVAKLKAFIATNAP